MVGTGLEEVAETSGTTNLNVDARLVPNALFMVGNNGANILILTAFADIIDGNSGDDVLIGGGGDDTFFVGSARTRSSRKQMGARTR